jgi:hypothetical protein
MPEITKKLTKLMKAVDRVLEDAMKVMAAGKEIKESLDKGKPEDENKSQGCG